MLPWANAPTARPIRHTATPPHRPPTMIRRLSRLTFALLALEVCAGCVKVSTDVADVSGMTYTDTRVNGALSLLLTDAPSVLGLLMPRPVAAASPGAITITASRYGSLCRYDVSGSTTTTGDTVLVRIVYAERLTSCTADVRRLTYVATVSNVRAGAHPVRVVHEDSAARDTVISETVIVP